MLKNKMRIKDILLSSLFASLIAAGAFIKIPMPVIPFTLQFLFSNLACLILGKKRGTLSVIIYMLIGIMGVPVFSQGGGIGYILNQNFGFIIGFGVGNFLAGYFLERVKKQSFFINLLISVLNLAIVYIIGIFYYFIITNYYLKNIVAITSLMITFFGICLPGDLLSVVLGCILARRLKIIVNKY